MVGKRNTMYDISKVRGRKLMVEQRMTLRGKMMV